MKRFKLWVLASLLLYLVLMLCTLKQLSQLEDVEAYAYRVEINRLMQTIKEQEMKGSIDIAGCTYIKEVQLLSRQEAEMIQAEAFFQEASLPTYRIQPIYKEEKLLGYAKFVYQLPDRLLTQGLFYVGIGFTIFEGFLLAALYWFHKKYLQPLAQLQTLPQTIAQGHYHKAITQQKHSPLNPFLLSVSQLRDDLQAADKRRLELEKQKKQMLLTISHDIKTPLHMIQLYSRAIAEGIYEQETDRNKATNQIIEKTKTMESFIDELVRTSREDILDIQVELEEFYLKDFMDQITDIYQEQCELRRLELIIGSFDNCLLKGDRDRLQEVMENLFMNAFKYGDGRKIEITFYEEEYHLMIRFFNTGSCVRPQEFHHLFDSFFRGTNAQGKSGSGLGLYICKEIMRKMEGDIYCEPQKDGMAFILVLA